MSEYDRHRYRRPRDRISRTARRRAVEELRRRHREEYDRLVDDYRAAHGLPPSKKGRPITSS